MIKKDFELPIVHIHQDIMPTLDPSKDSLEYAINFIIQKHQKQVSVEIIKNICQIMKDNGISDYYSIDEKRLLEIVDEAKAFEIIKESVGLKMSVDEDTGCLYVLLDNDNICVVGYVKGKDKVDLLKEALL